LTKTSDKVTAIDTREKTRLAYSEDGDGYDAHRLEDVRGRLLSGHDQKLFATFMPFVPVDLPTLEVGAGTGRFTLPLLEYGRAVLATDINEEMLRLLRTKVGSDYEGLCRVQVEDAFSLSFSGNEFGFLVSFHFIPRLLSVEDQEAALSELCRVVSPGGYLFFNFRNSTSLYRLLYRGHAISSKSVLKILQENGFSVVRMRGKHLISRKLIDLLPRWARSPLAKMDALLWSILPSLAWDVFVLAKNTRD